jgi:hypothetical protein
MLSETVSETVQDGVGNGKRRWKDFRGSVEDFERGWETFRGNEKRSEKVKYFSEWKTLREGGKL